MIKQFGLLFLLLSLPVLSHAAKGQGVEVRGTLPALVESEPGRIVSGSFLVTNTGAAEQPFIDDLQLPPGWRKIVPHDRHFSLPALKQQPRLVAFSIPPTAPAGEYTITYAVSGRKDAGVADDDRFTVRVLPVRKLALALDRKPERVIAGQAFLVAFRLLNLGNAADVVQLGIRTSRGFPVDPERPRASLEAGESRSFQLMVRTDGKLQNPQRCVVTVIAAVEGGKENSAILTTSVEILPSAPTIDLWRYAPARLRLIAAEEDGRFGLQAELSGGGAIDDGGKRGIDFLFRTPDIQDESLYGQRDEYRVNLYGEHLDFLLGDQSYALSPLTERGRYGRGGGARFRASRMGGGAFYLESRWQTPRESEVGTYLSYQLTEWFGLKGNYLRKEKGATTAEPDLRADLYSLEAALRWGREGRLVLEYGISDDTGETPGRNHAYRAELQGAAAAVRYSFERTFAGPAYFGYYRDVETMRGNVNFPLPLGVQGHLSYRSYRNNLELDPAVGTATDEASYRGGIRRPFSSGTTLSLEIEDIRKRDRLPAHRFDYREVFVTAGIGQSFRMASFQVHVDRGVIDNHLSGAGGGDLEAYSIFASLAPTSGQRYTFYGRFGHDKYGEDPERSKSLGISADWRLDRLCLGLNYQVNNLGEAGKRSGTLTSTLDYAFANRHTLNLRNRWSVYQDGREDDLSSILAYTIPLDIPVGVRSEIGYLTGRVYDAEAGGKPLANVLVTVAGFGAMTDLSGTFTFPALKPGEYYLAVENGSIGLDRVTIEKMPMAVTVRGGERAKVEIRVSRAGRISGQLALAAPRGEGRGKLDLVGAAGAGGEKGVSLANNLVKIARKDEVFRQTTDADGRFSFRGLRPGKWTVTVYRDNLPPFHYLEKETFEIELQGSETQELQVRVIPRVRTIQIVHQEKSDSAPPPSPERAAPPPAVAARGAVPVAKGEKYTLHGGTYLLASNRLQAEKIIRGLGFEPEARPVSHTVAMIRLLVGVYPAEAAKERMREIAGIAPGAFILPRGKQVAVYAGSYYYLDEAREFARRLARRGVHVEEEGAQVVMTLDRVTFGSFSNRAAAEEMAANAFAAGLSATVVRKD